MLADTTDSVVTDTKIDAWSAGIGGSGRQSAARLAAFMSGYALSQIEITKNYLVSDWRDDLRKIMKRAGVEGLPTVFLFGDHQIKVRSSVQKLGK